MLAERTEELRQFKARADALQELGREAQSSPLAEQQAITAYGELKGDLAQRLHQQESMKFEGVKPSYEAAFEKALLNAHIAMKSPTQTSPKNARWVSSVLALRSEIDYFLPKLEKRTTEE